MIAIVIAPAIMTAVAITMITPPAASIIDHRRRSIVTGRFEYHRGRRTPTEGVYVYTDVRAGKCGRACAQHRAHAQKLHCTIHHERSFGSLSTGDLLPFMTAMAECLVRCLLLVVRH